MGNYDSWLSAPYDDEKPRASGDVVVTIERPVPIVYIDGGTNEDFREYEVDVEMDEGSVHSAFVTHEHHWMPSSNGKFKCEMVKIVGGEIELTDNEIECIEVNWSEDQVDRADAAREDAADVRRECYDD